MAFLETKHTLSRISKIKKDLSRMMTVFSCISMLIFLAYYVYLSILNLNNYVYLSIYSALIVSIILLFCVEMFLRENKKILINEKRLLTEKKRRIKNVTKVLKYFAKASLVVIAIYETVNNFDLTLPNIINICSAVILFLQILFEIIVHYVIKQIDYFRLSTELDLDESSSVINKIMDIINPMKALQEKVILENKGALYSEQEQKMIKEIKLEAEKYSKEKQAKENELKQLLPEKKKSISLLGKLFKKD